MMIVVMSSPRIRIRTPNLECAITDFDYPQIQVPAQMRYGNVTVQKLLLTYTYHTHAHALISSRWLQ